MTTTHYCECETPAIDVEHDAGCRRCGLPVDFSPKTVTFDTPEGEVTMPVAQAEAAGKCIAELKAQDKEAIWHFANCGCCVVVHEAGPGPTAGYLIGSDGGYDWVEHSH